MNQTRLALAAQLILLIASSVLVLAGIADAGALEAAR